MGWPERHCIECDERFDCDHEVCGCEICYSDSVSGDSDMMMLCCGCVEEKFPDSCWRCDKRVCGNCWSSGTKVSPSDGPVCSDCQEEYEAEEDEEEEEEEEEEEVEINFAQKDASALVSGISAGALHSDFLCKFLKGFVNKHAAVDKKLPDSFSFQNAATKKSMGKGKKRTQLDRQAHEDVEFLANFMPKLPSADLSYDLIDFVSLVGGRREPIVGGKSTADDDGRKEDHLRQCQGDAAILSSILPRLHTSYLRVFVSSFVYKHGVSEPDTERKNKAAKV